MKPRINPNRVESTRTARMTISAVFMVFAQPSEIPRQAIEGRSCLQAGIVSTHRSVVVVQRSGTIGSFSHYIPADLQLVRDLTAGAFRHVARSERAGAHAPQFALGRFHAVDVAVEALPAQPVAQLVGGRLIAERGKL